MHAMPSAPEDIRKGSPAVQIHPYVVQELGAKYGEGWESETAAVDSEGVAIMSETAMMRSGALRALHRAENLSWPLRARRPGRLQGLRPLPRSPERSPGGSDAPRGLQELAAGPLETRFPSSFSPVARRSRTDASRRRSTRTRPPLPAPFRAGGRAGLRLSAGSHAAAILTVGQERTLRGASLRREGRPDAPQAGPLVTPPPPSSSLHAGTASPAPRPLLPSPPSICE